MMLLNFAKRVVPSSGLAALGLILLFSGCETVDTEAAARRAAMEESIRQEAPGNYFIGRRYFKNEYKMWGWVRQPGQPWSTAKLVMLNEQKTLAPDRAAGKLGIDHNHEYILRGHFSGDQVYEPASNRFYPEFVLSSAEVRSTSPPFIYADQRALDPAVRLLTPPL
jgi:hypothetical protein